MAELLKPHYLKILPGGEFDQLSFLMKHVMLQCLVESRNIQYFSLLSTCYIDVFESMIHETSLKA